VPDTVENEREFGRPGSGRGEGKAAYPQIQAVCLVEVGTHAVFDARMDGYVVAEVTLIEEMFGSLRSGMLVLADRHIYSFRRWLKAADTGADLLWRVTANLILRPVERLVDGSYLAEITPPKKSGSPPLRLRVIEYRLPWSDEVYRLVTTILDPVRAPAEELAALYHERWDIEGFLKQIKSVQLNQEKIFRSKSPDDVRQEFWAHLSVHYATMCVQVDAADQAQLAPDRISHKNTVRIIRSRVWTPSLFPLTHNDDHYQVVLAEVSGEINPEHRHRSYPRVIKRKMSNFPVKRPQHRQQHQPSRPPRSTIVIAPPSKTGHRRRPANTTKPTSIGTSARSKGGTGHLRPASHTGPTARSSISRLASPRRVLRPVRPASRPVRPGPLRRSPRPPGSAPPTPPGLLHLHPARVEVEEEGAFRGRGHQGQIRAVAATGIRVGSAVVAGGPG
jgi:hypothetical protein